MSCGVGHRLGSDLALLWLWRRPAATAVIGPLAWEHPYATGAALEMAKRQTTTTNLMYFIRGGGHFITSDRYIYFVSLFKYNLYITEFNFFFVCFCFLGLNMRHMEVPGLGVKLELQLQACTIATAMPDLSHTCDLHHCLQQC